MSSLSSRKRGPPGGMRGGPPPKRGMISRRGGPPHRDGSMRGPPRDGSIRGPPRESSMRGPPSRDGPPRGLSHRDGSMRGPPARDGPMRGPPSRDTSMRGPPRDTMRGPPLKDSSMRSTLPRDSSMRGPPRDSFRDSDFNASRMGGRPAPSRENSFGMSRGRGGRGRMGSRGRMMGAPGGRRSSMSGGDDHGLSRREDRLSYLDDRLDQRDSRSRDPYITSDFRDHTGRGGGYDRDRSAILSRDYASEQHDFYDSRPKPRERDSRYLHIGRDQGREFSRGMMRDSSRDFLRDDPLDSRSSFSRELAREYPLSRDPGRGLERRGLGMSREYSSYNNGDFSHDAPSRSHGSSREDFSRGPPMRRSSPGRGPPSHSARGMSSRGPPPSRRPPMSRGPPSRGPLMDSHGPPGRVRDDRGRGDMSRGRGRGRRPDMDSRGPPMKRPRSNFPPAGAMSRR